MVLMLRVKVKDVRGGALLPAYATEGSAGMDLHAAIPESLILQPLRRALIPCGIALELPEGYEAQLRPRSGLALKFGVTVANAPGTVDSDYRGEISVLLINLSDEPCLIEPGQRVAQMVIARVQKVALAWAEELGDTKRGAGGFGSTGQTGASVKSLTLSNTGLRYEDEGVV
jgi:dUTP pyrophosphatase